jgi:hypothetical protein
MSEIAAIVTINGFEIEVGSPTYDRLLKQGLLDAAATPSAGEPDGTPEKPLAERKREQLDAIATELGIDAPDKLPNKGAVVEAIEQARAAATPSAGEPDGTLGT